jgi:hypothetical protein
MGNCSNFDSISFLLTTFAACFSSTSFFLSGDNLKSGNKVEKKPVEENKIDTDKNKSEKKKIEVNEKFVRENPLLLKQIADALLSTSCDDLSSSKRRALKRALI